MHICQSPEWGEVKTKIGTLAVRVGEAQFTLHKVPLLPFNVGYCPKVAVEKIDWGKLKAAGKKHNCVFIKIEPNGVVNNEDVKKSTPIFATQTILLDLTKSEEELLAGMRQKTRYNVRLAEKKGAVVEERNDEEGLEIFLKLQKETAKRQGFFVHPDSYYQSVWEVLHPKGMAHLLIAKVENTPVVAWMLLKYQETFYYPYGGSSTEFKKYMASNLMMWEAIKLGKRLGCKVFDMWGATGDEKDPWYGFTRFKLGYGGELVSSPGAYDLILKSVWYKIFILADKLRWLILSLRKK